MNLYSNKQRWKIILLIFALLLIGISLYFSNSIVSQVASRERKRAEEWAEAIKKKAELVQLTNQTFTQLREKERREMKLWSSATKEIFKPLSKNQIENYDLPLKIINQNNSIPVILYDQNNQVSEFLHLDSDFSTFKSKHKGIEDSILSKKFNDTLIEIAKGWKYKIEIQIDSDFVMTCAYTDSKVITQLERNRDSLINAFNTELTTNDQSVPIILYNKKNDSIIATNMDRTSSNATLLRKTITRLQKKNKTIPIRFGKNQDNILVYDDSPELKKLHYFPYIQFIIISLFIFIGYLLFNTFRKAEQNQVWAGMAKETAHQLGTPLSSLVGWVEYLSTQNLDPSVPKEIKKDVFRLEQVANRFSKIGSSTQLENLSITETIRSITDYLKTRVSTKIEFTYQFPNYEIHIPHNRPLIEWVIENIVKNAVDSMENTGKITIQISEEDKELHIDILDTGKGMNPKLFKTIFKPGFTTKKRGWGLGLSLVKRIITEYHKGKVFVLASEIGKGTTIRISLTKNKI